MITITRGAVMMTPALALGGYESARPIRNRVHDILGRNDPDTTQRPASLRRGTLRMVFLTQAAAMQCEIEHAKPGPLRYQDTRVTAANMDYIPDEGGEIVTRLDPATGRWVITIPFREVLA